MPFYTIEERIRKIEDGYEKVTQFYVDVEAGVDDMFTEKNKLEERTAKIESDIKAIKKAIGIE